MWRKRAPDETLRDASYRYYMEHFCPADCGQEEGLPHLRNRLFVFILILVYPLSVVVYIPSAIISFVSGAWEILVADTVTVGVLGWMVLSRHLSLRLKKYLFSAIFSILATLLLIFIGPGGPGDVILFSTSILMTLFISRKSGVIAVFVNLALMLATEVALPMTGYAPPGIQPLSISGAMVIALNMFAFNLLTVLGLDGLIRELNNSLLKEKKSEAEIMDLYVNLEKKINARTLELADTNQKLTEEISQHEYSRRELEKTTVELENFFNLTPNLLCIGDPGGRLLKVNQACQNLLGYRPEELLGRTILEYVHPDDIAPTVDSLDQLGRGEHVMNFVSRFRKPDASFCYLEWHAILHNGFIYAAASDISVHKLIEENLNRARKDAEDANHAKSEFLANMSHEIRTPMNAVLGYSELLGSSRLDPVQKEYVDSLKSSGKSLLRLINDILDISKIEAGRMELEYDFINTVDFFTEFEKIFAFKIREKGIRFDIVLHPDIPRGIRVDESRLRQIVFNLLGNAIKFTSEGSIELRIYTRPAAGSKQEPGRSELVDLYIEVEDTGIGISHTMQERIFEPFVQERNYRSAGGTGLGLPISRRLVHLMQGTIRLQSELGKGSTFTVCIPQIESLHDYIAPQPEGHFDPSAIRFGKARLLIVDDVQHNRNYLIDALKETTIQTYEAENGTMGLELARNLKPDLIITDIRMPGMNGYEMLDHLREDDSLKHIPVLAYSASVLNMQQYQDSPGPFAGMLIKPVKLHDLYKQLMKHIPYENVPAEMKPAASNPSDVVEVSELQALITSLETDFQDTWKGFAMRQPIGQIMLFAKGLIELGSKHNADAVIRYGEELREAAENFNIESILALLDRYSAMVARLRDRFNPN